MALSTSHRSSTGNLIDYEFMPLKVITPQGGTHFIRSPQDFEEIFHVRYLSQLQFCDDKLQLKVQQRCDKALKKKWMTARQKWLGHYYAQGIHGKLPLDLTIAWIDESIGYGVWTNRDLPANSYIGEYTGLVRKRGLFGRWHNLYCFDYDIGEGRRTPFVIDARDSGNHTRFINHSFQGNIEPVSVYCDQAVHVILYAKESIAAGTQLCYDYGENYWKKRGKPTDLFAANTKKINFR